MIIIFNLMGAVFGLLGLAGAFVIFGLTRSLTAGLLTLSGIWCWFGRAKPNAPSGEMGAAPSLFFIPLFYWGILPALAIVPAIALDISMILNPEKYTASDPLRSQFNADEAGLKTNESDIPELSADLILFMSKAMPGEPVNLRIKSSKDSVLVLAKACRSEKDPQGRARGPAGSDIEACTASSAGRQGFRWHQGQNRVRSDFYSRATRPDRLNNSRKTTLGLLRIFPAIARACTRACTGNHCRT